MLRNLGHRGLGRDDSRAGIAASNIVHNVVRASGRLAGMDTDRHAALRHEARSEDVRAFLTGELEGLIDELKAQLKFDMSAGMTAALIQAYRELGRLYQVAEKPGGKGFTEVQVARMIAEAQSQARLEVLETLSAEKQKALTQASRDVRESLEALSAKSLG